MGKIKEDDLFDAINESDKIKNLIRKIANASSMTPNEYSAHRSEGDTKEIDSLNSQIGQLQSKLHQADIQLRQTKSQLEIYKKTVDDLQAKVDKYQLELQEKSEKNFELENEIGICRNDKLQLSSELNSITGKYEKLKQQFQEPLFYYDKYQSLSFSTRSGLENIVCVKNEITFIASCANEDSLSALWQYAKEISGRMDCKDDFEALCQIFDWFFELYNGSLPNRKYVRESVEVGDDFDDEYHDRCHGSATSGEIKEILLRGYKTANTGRVVQKSLVRV